KERRARFAALAAEANVRRTLHAYERDTYPVQIRQAHQEWQANSVPAMMETLQSCPPRLRHWEWYYLNSLPSEPVMSWQAHRRVRAVALAPDLGWLATGGNRGVIKFWEPHTGKELRSIRAHRGYINDLCVSPDGRFLASSGQDGRVCLWETDRWSGPNVLAQQERSVKSLSFSHNGRLAAGGTDRWVKVWDAATAEEIYSTELPQRVNCISLNHDGTRLMIGHLNSPASVIDLDSGTRQTLKSSTVVSARWSSHDDWLAMGDANLLHVCDPYNGSVLRTIELGTEQLMDLDASADLLAAAGNSRSIRLFRLPSAQPLIAYRGHDASVDAVALDDDQKLLVSADRHGVVKTWRLGPRQDRIQWPAHQGPVREIALGRDGKLIASVSDDGTLRLWRADSGQLLRTIDAHRGGAHCVAFLPDGDRIATGGMDRSVHLWNIDTGKRLQSFRGHTRQVWGLAVSSNGELLASGSTDASVRLWEIASGKLQHTLIEPPSLNTIHGLEFSSDNRFVFAGTGPMLRSWSVKTGRLRSNIEAHESSIFETARMPDDRIVTVAMDGTARIWDAGGDDCQMILRTDSSCRTVARSPQGLRLVTGHFDRTLRIWDTSIGRELLQLETPGTLLSAEFSPDGRRLVGGLDSGKIVIWSW
ncbi:MAG: WD40 repeat domain-containing protein, partial [Pirellulales bacterium]|nr:WD40 repeat domain-containing protein [Pirellulales bacterium]